MLLRTKDYSIFKFREDNRDEIEESTVRKLMESMSQNNMLEIRPVLVNAEMEIIDGQNRVKAAERLGIEVVYQINENLKPSDILLLQVSSAWKMKDYLNYYVKNHYPEYIKLNDFMKQNNLSLKTAMAICCGTQHNEFKLFRDGKFQFKNDLYQEHLDLCWETIGYIRKIQGFSPWCDSTKFWQALIRLFTHVDFEAEKWRMNFKMKVDYFNPRATQKDYLKLVCAIYNFRNQRRINLIQEETLEA